MPIDTLIQNETLKIALKPYSNLTDIGGIPKFTMPIIAEDYAARTALMWNAVYEELGFSERNCMVVASPEQVGEIIQQFRNDSRYVGGGAGVGFKEVVMAHLDELTPLAAQIGSVNIIQKTSDGRLVGDNTDGAGYAESLEQSMRKQGKELKGSRVLILGAGGTGRAIAFALADRGASLVILNRTKAKAFELSESVNTHFGHIVAVGGGRELIVEYLPSCDAVVSVIDDATSPLDGYSTLGEMELPVTPESLDHNRLTTADLLKTGRATLVVSDIRLRNEETPMLAQAREHGFAVLDGVPMVVNQGVAAFWWLYGDTLTEHGVSKDEVAKLMWEVVQK